MFFHRVSNQLGASGTVVRTNVQTFKAETLTELLRQVVHNMTSIYRLAHVSITYLIARWAKNVVPSAGSPSMMKLKSRDTWTNHSPNVINGLPLS